MRWCCAQFQGWHAESGQRGLGVFARKMPEGDSAFVLQHRAAEPNVRVITDPVAPFSIVAEIGIQYCPWCGVRLLEWYRQDLRMLERPDL